MVTCVCAPVIDAEMRIWTSLGGGNSGCCGDQNHKSGFHLAGGNVPPTDYSRRHEAAKPFDMSWACAGDFSHRGNPTLRSMHAVLLARLMRGELPMICEFIGQPWPDKPVYYWAAWNGVNKLKQYTGKGHDHWSHISWWRSKANLPAGLWAPSMAPLVTPAPPPKPGMLSCDGELGPKTIKRWQQVMGTTADGVISHPRSSLVMAVQRHLNARIGARLKVDGDGIRQNGRRYETVRALQRYLHTPVDGKLSPPKSMCVQALQRRLNLGQF